MRSLLHELFRRPDLPRLSAKEGLILEQLSRREMYGLELVAASEGALKRGTVYVTLGRMEDKGWVRSKLDRRAPPNGGLPRRLYQPTAEGLRVLRTWESVAASLSGRRRAEGRA